jgi:hypothetical protein
MTRTNLSYKELNERCGEVFLLEENEEVEDVYEKNGRVVVIIQNFEEDETIEYEPNLSDRPQALEYILGLRDSFAD